jgi:predicted phage terminase large subunit-like protein
MTAPKARRTPEVLWRPNPGPQTRFLASRANETLYGGAAGGGKSAALIACPLRWVHNPNYRGLYLRREATYLGNAVDKSRAIYPAFGAVLVQSPRIEWRFPSGATLWMGHCAAEGDVANYDSFEFAEILFDELTHFTERQYRGIRARLRGTDPTLPYWSRAATNPGGVGHEWVKARWSAWLDRRSERPAGPGEVRWFAGDQEVPQGTEFALSRTFIPAKLADNPHTSPAYRAQLRDLDPVRRLQLEDGDWEAAYGEGKVFHKTWWRYLETEPVCTAKSRGWDFGAGGDPSEGVLLGDRGEGTVPRYVVLDVKSHIGPSHELHRLVRATAEEDGESVLVAIPQDPGQAGKDQAQTFIRELDGFTVLHRPMTGDKVVRAGPASSQAGAGNFAILRGPWNHAFTTQAHEFPDSPRDDKIDALSEAFNALGHAPTGDERTTRAGRRR